MKCVALFAALCFLGVCAGESLSLDFLHQNLLSPMINQIYQNAVGLLGQQLNDLVGSLFGGIGKRDLSAALNVNAGQVLNAFITKVKGIYENVFNVFLQVVQHAQDWVAKPAMARIAFVHAAADAEQELGKIHLDAEFLQPLVNFVQQHMHNLADNFEVVIQQAIANVKPIQNILSALKQ